MAQPFCKIKLTRSRDDYDLYHLTLPKFDPATLTQVRLSLPPSQLIRAEHPFFFLTLSPQPPSQDAPPKQTQLSLSINLSGVVEAVSDCFEKMEEVEGSYRLKEPPSKSNLQILSLRECDHQPRQQTFLGNDYKGRLPHGRPFASSVTLCNTCSVPLWKYYDPQEIEITFESLCKLNSVGNPAAMLGEFNWSITINEQFTPTTEIGQYEGQEVTLPYLAKATYLANFEEGRKRMREGTVVMRLRRVVCGHEKILEERCQYCFEQVREEGLTSYLFQDEKVRGNVFVRGSALKQHEEQYVEALLNSQKAIIILDLDNTILHSNEISELDLPTVASLRDFYLIPKLDCPSPQLEHQGRRDLIVVKMRPYFRHFLYLVTKYYEIYVYTKGTRIYAQEICKYIRAQYAGEERAHPYLTWNPEKLLFLKDKKSFTSNIISRDEDSSLDSKSFDRILPTKTEYHLILDDRRDVWNNSPAWFFTREYYYFFKKPRKVEEASQDIMQYITSSTSPPTPKETGSTLYTSSTTSDDMDLPEMHREVVEEFKQIKQLFPDKDTFIETNQKNDYYLLFAAYALKKIHKNFFEAIRTEKAERESKIKERGDKEMGEQHGPNSKGRKYSKINLAYQYAKTKFFFKNMKFRYFLGEDQHENNNNTIRRAKKMGAATHLEDSPKFIIRANDLMKQTKRPQANPNPHFSHPQQQAIHYYYQQKMKLNQLFNAKIPVISESWIHYCYQYNYPFSHEPFKLYDPFQVEINHEDFSEVVEKQGKLICKSIEAEMEEEHGGEPRKKYFHLPKHKESVDKQQQ